MRRTQFELDKMWDLWGKPVNLDKARNRTSHQDSEHFDWKKENKIQISHISGSCSKVTKLHQLAYRPAVNRKVRVMILNNNQPSGDMKFWINSVTVSRGKVEINLEYQEYTIKQRTQQWKWLIRVTTMVNFQLIQWNFEFPFLVQSLYSLLLFYLWTEFERVRKGNCKIIFKFFKPQNQ